MRFRCPNCNNGIVVELPEQLADETLNELTCPSCHSRFSLSGHSAPTQVPAEGMTVGRFEVREVVGEGAFGTVYKAWDPQLSRFVALKVAREGRVRLRSFDEMLREARAAASIRHEGVVRVHEVGPYRDSIYIASELIDGITLTNWLKHRRPSIEETCEIIKAVCDSVQAAHEAGVIHRDLKPGNILMDLQGVPHITDFGLARHDDPANIVVSSEGGILGTPAYMSPEQARGADVGTTTDVYSIGTILYEMLAGQRPFIATDSRTVLYRIQTEPPPSPRSLNSSIPVDLERVCLHALEKSAENRYSSARELGEDLDRYVRGFPVRARRYGRLHRFVKLVGRNRGVSLTVVAVLVAGLLGAALATRSRVEQNPTLSVLIQTDPPAERLEFIRYDEFLRVPDQSSEIIRNADPAHPAELKPGLYRVRGFASGERFHEVWRVVPEHGQPSSRDQGYPHKSWMVDTAGAIVLPAFSLYADSDVEVPLAEVPGGEFVMGIRDTSGFSEVHRHQVEDLLVGINEVSCGEFRRVLGRAKHWTSDMTCLEFVEAIYGDSSARDPELPVTGYPRDVAILFCELAGGRLPDNAEWEYVATQRGQSEYSTGNEPPRIALEDWKVMPVTVESPDSVHPFGIRNLCCSVAEFTDSTCASYRWLFPVETNRTSRSAEGRDLLAMMAQSQEIRGGDAEWLSSGAPPRTAVSARTRASDNPMACTDEQSPVARARLGWRMVRTDRR